MHAADQGYKLVGPISIVFIWAMGLLMVRLWPGEHSMSLSQHAAAQRNSYLLFAGSLSIAGIAFYLFCIKWLVPTFQLPAVFDYLLGAGFILQIVTAVAPDIPGLMSKIHRSAAYTEGILLPVMLSILSRSPYVDSLAKIISIIVVLLAFVYLGIFWGIKSSRRHYLFYQSSYIVMFHIAILVTIFFGIKG